MAVLDRTKEPGAQAEPLYLDVMTALAEAFNNGERDLAPCHWWALWSLFNLAQTVYWRYLPVYG